MEKPNEDTLVFFCHFGLECVLLAHLIGASPMVLWHGFCAAPSSVTTVNTEERREGIASFRISAFGDISHLYVHDEPPAFAARFCEMYSNTDEHLINQVNAKSNKRWMRMNDQGKIIDIKDNESSMRCQFDLRRRMADLKQLDAMGF